MKIRRLLYLCAQQMTAYRWQAGELVSEASFATTADGHRLFAAYLRHNARHVFAILANVSEEGFHVETIPSLHGADRRALLTRKLGQIYFNNSLCAALSLGRSRNQRPEERVLLTALTNNELLAPWLDAIAAARIALAGVYSLPLLAAALLRRLGIADEPCLLLSIQDQSVRQSYFENGELYFSRLAPLPNSSLSGIAQSLASEAQKLQQYLVSQRLIGRQQPICAYLLTHAGAQPTVAAECIDSPTLYYRIIDIDECARRTGLKTPLPTSHSEAIFLNLLAYAAPRVQLADDDVRHDYHLERLRSALYGTGGLTLLGSLLFCGYQALATQAMRAQVEQLNAEARAGRQRYQEIVSTFPALPTDTDTLRRIVGRYASIEQQSRTPQPLYHEISRALHAVPAASIERIDWQVGGEPSSSAGTPPPVAKPTIAGQEAGKETAVVHGTLDLPANASMRQVLAAFDTLLTTLKSNAQLQVSVVHQPFDVAPAKPLKGSDAGLESATPRAFAIQIAHRSEP